MTSQLEYVSDGDIITADRQNDITDYVERALYRTNTKYLMVGDIIVIDALRNAIVNGLTIGSLNGLLKASNGVVSTASANTDYLIDLSNFTTSNLIEGTNLYFTNARAQTALSSHTSDSSIHFTQGNISVTESQVSDLKNYFDKDVDTSDSVTDTATNRFTNDVDIARLANTSGTNTGDQDLSGLLPNSHLTDFTHSDIAHTNRSSLDLVSGTNTGDQVLPTRDSLGLDTDDIVTFANLSGTNTGDQTLPVNSDFNLSDLGDVDDTDKAEGKILKVNSAGTHVYVNDESGTDEKVKYDVNDPTAGYLADKFIAGDGISLTEGTSADENKLLISNSGIITESDPLSLHLDQTTPQSVINGNISVITPTSDYHIATKKYVDDAIVAAIDDSWDGSY